MPNASDPAKAYVVWPLGKAGLDERPSAQTCAVVLSGPGFWEKFPPGVGETNVEAVKLVSAWVCPA